KTFMIAGVLSLAIVFSGFYFLVRNQFLLSLMQILLGGIIFYFVIRKAKKESWYGKPIVKK
ncbi:MAG TPA: hypothetical protein VJ110_03565, partial [Candidatus Nanoarchaeia archaeon]|nr:hypothetical protein [Candidatus Nanoarchaeia archaeon]